MDAADAALGPAPLGGLYAFSLLSKQMKAAEDASAPLRAIVASLRAGAWPKELVPAPAPLPDPAGLQVAGEVLASLAFGLLGAWLEGTAMLTPPAGEEPLAAGVLREVSRGLGAVFGPAPVPTPPPPLGSSLSQRFAAACAWLETAMRAPPAGEGAAPTLPPHPAEGGWPSDDEQLALTALSPEKLLTNLAVQVRTGAAEVGVTIDPPEDEYPDNIIRAVVGRLIAELRRAQAQLRTLSAAQAASPATPTEAP